MSQPHLQLLKNIRTNCGPHRTLGLPGTFIMKFLDLDLRLGKAIEEAARQRQLLGRTHEDWFQMDEEKLCAMLQERLLNFYNPDSINPYVPLAALGPWIITTHGAVIHDSGGYGMLGLGHAPEPVLTALSAPYVMANVMTPSFQQKHLTDRLVKEIGRSRGSCPFSHFVCLNSGSESVTFTCRVTDIHARRMTEAGGKHAGKQPVRLAAVDSFHGRTEGPARLSHSTRSAYVKHLASYQGQDGVAFIPFNDVAALKQAFAQAEKSNQFIEAFFVEPVMGEGIPGLALDRAFYDEARALTNRMGSLLIVDSIQAALRAQGCLSLIDYPGFESCEPPDMETYSKALNAGQYPLSVIAMRESVAKQYVTGLYGNTMTANPRAMETACAVLDGLTENLRQNIRERGREFVAKFQQIANDFPGAVDRVVGTGLMASLLLNPAKYKVIGRNGFEQFLRRHGVEMIHGGDCGLRFTPSFDITSAEVDLIVEMVRKGLKELG